MIENKLKLFIKKYYLNTLQLGVLITLSCIIITTLTFAITEHLGRFNNITRFIFYILFIIINGLIILKHIIKPILQLGNILKRIDYKKASKLISNNFDGINDEIINYLELKNSENNNELKIAAINQKNKKYSNTDFTKAIDKKNKNLLIKITFTIFIFFILILFIKPNIIKDSSERIINYKKDFYQEKFDVNIKQYQLTTPIKKEHTIDIYLTGEEVPGNVKIEIDGLKYQTQKITNKHYKYTFRNIKKSITFKVENKVFKLKVYKKAIIKSYSYTIYPPKHTKKSTYKINNQPEFTIEEGSSFDLVIEKEKNNFILINNKKTKEILSGYLIKDTIINIECYNNYDTITQKHQIKIKKDLQPEIKIKHYKTDNYITDTIKIIDDYGFNNLSLIIINNKDTLIRSIVIDKNSTNQIITNKINTNNNDIKYYYIVYDNDKINNYKSKSSKLFNYKRDNIINTINKQKEKYKQKEKSIKETIKETNNIKNTISKEKRNQINNKSNNNQENLKKQLTKQLEIEQKIRELEKELNIPNNDSLNKNIEKLLKQIEKLNKELDPEELNKTEDEINKNNKIQEEKLKRTLDLLKNKKAIEELKKISEELKKEKQNIDNSDISDTLILKKFKENLKTTEEEINKNLNQLNKKENNINELNKASEELNKKNKEEAKKQIQKTIEKIEKELKNKEKKENEINYKDLKQALYNTINISIIQESYISNNINIEKQLELNNNLTNTTDSILEISKNSPYLSNTIIDLIFNIKEEQEKIIPFYEEGNINQIKKSQQTITIYLNDIALLLNKALDQTKKQMEGTPSKPSNKKQIEKQLQEQLKKLQDKKGKKLSSGEKLDLIKDGEKINNELKKLENKDLIKKLEKNQNEIKKDIINNNINNNTIEKAKEQFIKFIEYNNSENNQNKNEEREANQNTNESKILIESKIEHNKNIYINPEIKNKIQLKELYKIQNEIYINNKIRNE